MNPLRSFDRRRGNAQGVVSVSICGLVVEVRIKHRVKLADPQVCIEAAAPPRRAPSAATLAAGGTGHRQGATNAVQRASAPVVVAISAPRRRFWRFRAVSATALPYVKHSFWAGHDGHRCHDPPGLSSMLIETSRSLPPLGSAACRRAFCFTPRAPAGAYGAAAFRAPAPVAGRLWIGSVRWLFAWRKTADSLRPQDAATWRYDVPAASASLTAAACSSLRVRADGSS